MTAGGGVLARIEAVWGLGSPEYAAAAELERKARLWDSLMHSREETAAEPDTAAWKEVARNEGLIPGVRACRAAHGYSLTEARDCVEGYLSRLAGTAP